MYMIASSDRDSNQPLEREANVSVVELLWLRNRYLAYALVGGFESPN